MAEEYGAKIVIEGNATGAVRELDRLKKSMGGVAATSQDVGKKAGAAFGASGPLGSLARGNISGGFASLATSIGPVGLALTAVGTAAAATIGAIKEWQGYALGIANLADKLGTTTEEASALNEIASDLGVNMGSLVMGFRTLSKQGLEPSIEGLIAAKHQIEATKNPTDRLVKAQQLLGRAAGDLLPIFAQLSDEQLRNYIDTMGAGEIITAQEAARARKLRDELDQLSDAWENAKLEAGGYFAAQSLPGLERFTDVLSGQISVWDAWASMVGITTGRMGELNAEQVRLTETERLTALARSYDGLATSADTFGTEAQQAFEDARSAAAGATEAYYLNLAAEALLAGNEDLANKYLGLSTEARNHANQIQRTIDLLKKLDGTKVSYTIIKNIGHEQGVGGAGGYQHGGRIMDDVALVGEAGPELIINGVVVPANETRRLRALGLGAQSHHGVDYGTAGSGLPPPPAGTPMPTPTSGGGGGGGSGGGGGGGGKTPVQEAVKRAVVASVAAQTSVILAAMPSPDAIKQAVIDPTREQAQAIVASNNQLADKMDAMIMLLQRAATNDGIGRAVRDQVALRV